jgi:hypothetical protein
MAVRDVACESRKNALRASEIDEEKDRMSFQTSKLRTDENTGDRREEKRRLR